MDGLEISFNGQVDLGMVAAFAALALTLIQWAASVIKNHRAAAKGQAASVCARVVRMRECESASSQLTRVNLVPQFGLEVMNSSNDIVYEVVLTLVFTQGAAWHDGRGLKGQGRKDGRVLLSCVAPGKTVRQIGPVDTSMHRVPGCEIAFTDRCGRSWVRSANRKLRRIHFRKSPVEYYGLIQPVEYADYGE